MGVAVGRMLKVGAKKSSPRTQGASQCVFTCLSLTWRPSPVLLERDKHLAAKAGKT